MSDSPSPEPLPLGRLASLLVLIAGGLYFTGWTYRWAYFSFFQLDVTTLPLPVESFYMAAFHALFGSPWAILRTGVTLVGVAIAVGLILWLFERKLLGKLQQEISRQQLTASLVKKYETYQLHVPHHRSETGTNPQSQVSSWIKLKHKTRGLIVNQLWVLQRYSSFQFLRSLIDEIIIAICLLAALFWLARWQAADDAWADAIHTTSGLPSVTIVSPENTTPFGFNPSTSNNPSDIRIIGNINAYNSLLTLPTDDPNYATGAIAWRLLLDINGDYYIFPAMPENSPRDRRPRLLIIPRSEDGHRLILLQPAPP